jgi:hypothetical protein
MIVSIKALSNASPTLPIEGLMPSSARCSLNRMEVYWADSSGRCNTLIRRCWSGTSAKLGHSGDGKAGDAVARASTGGES